MFFEYFGIRYSVIFDIGKAYTSDDHRETTEDTTTDTDSFEIEAFVCFDETVSV